MTKLEIVGMIRAVLSERMTLSRLSQFSEDARLNEHLGLDSVLVLQLLVHLELEFGLALPEEALLEKQLGTVGSLADFLLQRTLSRATPTHPEGAA